MQQHRRACTERCTVPNVEHTTAPIPASLPLLRATRTAAAAAAPSAPRRAAGRRRRRGLPPLALLHVLRLAREVAAAERLRQTWAHSHRRGNGHSAQQNLRRLMHERPFFTLKKRNPRTRAAGGAGGAGRAPAALRLGLFARRRLPQVPLPLHPE